MSVKAIDLERFAAIGAEIEQGAAEEEVLSREGISLVAWTEAQEEWLSKLAEETAERESDELNTRYRKAFEERAAELAREAKERPSPPAEEAGPSPAEPPPEEPDLETEPAVQPPLPAPVGARTMAFAAAGASPASALPFQAAPPVAKVAPPPVSIRAGLPFQAAFAGTESPAPAQAPVSIRGGLPFQPAPGSGGVAPGSGGVAPGSGGVAPGSGGVAPGGGGVAAGGVAPVRLTLEQFAQLSAELAAAPAAQAVIAARYGLEPGAPAMEHQAWSKRFALDRGLYERFCVLYKHYAAWLASPRR